MSVVWCSPVDLFNEAKRYIERPDVLLDIGCGVRPQTLVAPNLHICCEPFDEYAQVLTSKSLPGQVVAKLSWADALVVFPARSVDSVFLLDVIEHLEKPEGVRLLDATAALVRKQIVVFTPLGFLPQPRTGGLDGWNLGGDAVQEHKSGWLPEDFDASWQVIAAEGVHTEDVHGKPFGKPYGAFFAVKTVTQVGQSELDRRRVLVDRVRAGAAAVRELRVLEATADLMDAISRTNRAWFLAGPIAVLEAELRLRDSPMAVSLYKRVTRLQARLLRPT